MSLRGERSPQIEENRPAWVGRNAPASRRAYTGVDLAPKAGARPIVAGESAIDARARLWQYRASRTGPLAELADAADSKSADREIVPVRFRGGPPQVFAAAVRRTVPLRSAAELRSAALQ